MGFYIQNYGVLYTNFSWVSIYKLWCFIYKFLMGFYIQTMVFYIQNMCVTARRSKIISQTKRYTFFQSAPEDIYVDIGGVAVAVGVLQRLRLGRNLGMNCCSFFECWPPFLLFSTSRFQQPNFSPTSFVSFLYFTFFIKLRNSLKMLGTKCQSPHAFACTVPLPASRSLLGGANCACVFACVLSFSLHLFASLSLLYLSARCLNALSLPAASLR